MIDMRRCHFCGTCSLGRYGGFDALGGRCQRCIAKHDLKTALLQIRYVIRADIRPAVEKWLGVYGVGRYGR